MERAPVDLPQIVGHRGPPAPAEKRFPNRMFGGESTGFVSGLHTHAARAIAPWDRDRQSQVNPGSRSGVMVAGGGYGAQDAFAVEERRGRGAATTWPSGSV